MENLNNASANEEKSGFRHITEFISELAKTDPMLKLAIEEAKERGEDISWLKDKVE